MAYEFGGYGAIAWLAPPRGWLGAARAAVSARTGGSSPEPYASLNLGRMTQDDPARVAENDRRWRDALRLPDGIARARLEHGSRCLVADSPGVYEACDGLLTSARGLPLWITVADCYPVFLVAAVGVDADGLEEVCLLGADIPHLETLGMAEVLVDHLASC